MVIDQLPFFKYYKHKTMKHHLQFLNSHLSKSFFTMVLVIIGMNIQAQTRIGVKTSLGLKLNSEEAVLHSSDNIMYTDQIKFLGQSSTKSIGLFIRKQSDFLFLETDLMYSTYQSSFSVQDLTSNGIGVRDIPAEISELPEAVTYTDTYQNIDLAILAGYTHRNFDFGVGPIFHRTLSHQSELSEIEGYQSKRKLVDPGFQFKVGYNLGRLNVGIKYEDYFLKAGDHFTLDTKKLKFKSGLNSLKLELAYGF